MKGLTFAHSDWDLQKVGDSYGKSTCQAGTVLTAFSTDNWHYDMYRNLDTIPGAVQLEFAHHINILDGAVMLTGAEGVNMKNDVVDCQVTGNYFYQTGGSGVVVGNPQHIYENDSLEPDTYVHHVDSDPAKDIFGATADKEKYQNGLEAIPRNVTISNNLFAACARLFPSNVTVTSFYTENLQVEHNWLKDTAYSGMNIGWGWCDFDGKTADFQDWGEPYRASIIPGIPTSTCKENKLLNNRIDDTMQILHDGGSIYTLGQQDGTQIAGNYLRNTQFALYQDEGSANFATIQNNVMSGKSTYSIAAVEYGRKHDLTYDNNYATNASCGISNVPGMNIKNENFNHVADGVWPLEAYEITLNAGLQKEYVQKYADELSALHGGPQDVVLPASVKMNDGDALPIMGFLSASDKIWLAPAGTTGFTEGDSMTVASGDAETITVPKLDGEYRIYVEYSDGTVSDASHYSVQVTNTSAKLGQHALTLYQTGKVYGQLTIENLDDASSAVWSSSQPEIATVDQNGLVKALQAGSTVITAQVGDLALTCQITVKETPVSSEALTMWFSADKGVTLDADGTSVKSWQSQTDSGVELIQNTADNMPQLITDDNGVKHLQFVNDSLSLDGVDFNNKSNLSIILVAHYTGTNYDSGWSGETNTDFFAPSSASWSGLYVAPYQKYIMARFGSGVANCQLQCNRDHEIDANSITAAVKDGSLEKVYVDGVEDFSRDGQAAATKDIGSTLYVGTGFLANNNWYYQETISEILVYDRSLTSAEVADISLYLKSKYGLPVDLKSITATSPTKTEYEISEELDLTGLEVTAHYEDGKDTAVSDYQVSGFDSTAAGEKTVTVSYGGQSTTFTVTVKAPVTVDPIEVTAPSKTEYEIGEALDLTGLAVTAHYSDGSESDVTDDCEVTGFDSATAGEKAVTVSYEGQTATFTVTVKAPKPEITLTSIEVTAPVKIEHKIGEALDLTGLAVTAHYSDGSENDVTADCEVTGFDSAAAGEKTVTVSYKGQKATFKVTVKEAQATAALKSITVAGPAKTEYQVGEGMDLTGLVVTAHYSDSSSKTVTGYQVTGFDSTKAGKFTLTVSYSEGDLTKTASVELTVKAKDAGGNSDNNSSQGSSSSGETNSSPAQTGDRFPMAAGISLVVISFACLGALIVLKRKGKAD